MNYSSKTPEKYNKREYTPREKSGIHRVEVTNDTIKKDVLTYFFERINYYEYRYLILKTLDDLKKNEKNIEFVIPHIKGDPYFLLFGTFDRKNSVYLIEKKKLKFNLNQCNIDEIKIYSCSIKSIAKTYIGSIFDGRFVQDIFLIQDCYLLDGIKMNAWKIDKKIEYIDEYLSKNIKNPYIKIRNVDLINNIEELDKIISKSNIDINGYIFLQLRSGISYIFMDNENFNKNKEKSEINNNIVTGSSNIVTGSSIHVNNNIVTKSSIQVNNTDDLILIVKKDNKPDVYHIYDNNNNLIHFASIPDTITSQLCYEGLKNVDSAMFKCVMCPKWKRYKPVELVIPVK